MYKGLKFITKNKGFYNGGKEKFSLRAFLGKKKKKKKASICLHDIPKDEKIQNFGDVFSTFLDFFLNFIKNQDFGFLKI